MMEEERWVMHGLNADDPNCIKNVEQLQEYIEKIGFLPLFRNEIPGFSVEEHTAADSWWSEDPESDPWEWRKIIAGNGRIAYGKFFDKKAGFISRGWLPAFANYRRDGYDFDARWDDELASIRSKKIMDLFAEENADRELYSFEVKRQAGFGSSGEKNFEGTSRVKSQGCRCRHICVYGTFEEERIKPARSMAGASLYTAFRNTYGAMNIWPVSTERNRRLRRSKLSDG